MGCDPSAIPYLTLLAGWDFGNDDPNDIQVLGVPVAEVATNFVSPSYACHTDSSDPGSTSTAPYR